MRMWSLGVAVLLCLARVSTVLATDHPGLQANEALVCFVDFRIAIESQITAGTIERRGCHEAIDAGRFLAMLSPMSPTWPFDDRAIRAKVTLPDGRVYLVDKEGAACSGNRVFLLGRIAFTESLRRLPWLE